MPKHAVDSLFAENAFDAVVHAAGIASVDYVEKHDAESLESNIVGTLNVTSAARRADTHLIDISTNAVFDGKKTPYREDDPLGPVNKYGGLKVDDVWENPLYNISCGQARILFLFLDGKSEDVSAPDRTARVSFYDLARDPGTPVATVDGEFIWTIQDERGMYIANVTLPEAGQWGAEFTTEAPGSPAETVRLTFEVHDASPWTAVGDPAPTSDSPTLADVGGVISLISTDKDPDPAFYGTSVADALAAHTPFILIFATPKFCTTAQCGPTLDRFKPVAAANPKVTFINVEPYQLQAVESQLQPLLDANGNLQAAVTTQEWGLYFEPWMFAVDRDGIVRGSYEVAISDQELADILQVITAGS